jgi:phage baseplate assembly protein gpV
LPNKTIDFIRQGVISSVNYEEGRVRVLYEDKNDTVTKELPLLNFEYDMPKVGDPVYVSHQSNGVENGIVISRYWQDGEKPIESGWNIWRKEMRDGAEMSPGASFLKFDRQTHTFFLNIVDSPSVSLVINAAKDVNISSTGGINVTAAETISVSTETSMNLSAENDINIKAQTINIEGNIKQQGDIDSTGKVTAIQGEFGPDGQTVTITTHKHKGVTTGTSDTANPVQPS